ncbi:MAG: hypothetical protein CVU87_10140 [Firmicutes bacterium HGW-Firmicutes-12]|jgi:hypothetical protein|nr:MAG: hypothetical protein CVU87_10140 [Firmicutes bacterium HGW-Firmicutes-12]
MMSKYEKNILNKLLDKYEKSKSFTGDNKVNQKFAVKIVSLFPQYVDHANFEVFQAVNEAVDVLSRKKLISARVNQANVCTEVHLNLAAIDQAYQYMGRTQKRDINNAVIKLLEHYKEKNVILKAFCETQLARIRENKTVQILNDDLQEFENVLLAVERLLEVEVETFARDFSVRVFKDSKLFDRISSKVVNLLYEYGDFPEKDKVLESLNTIKNPTYVNFKGAGVLIISGQHIDLNTLRSDMAISSSMLEDIEEITITGKSVMTIENLTSFHRAENKDTFFIYLGGFHNRIRREFIKRIHNQNPRTEFYHFGDMDAGGFYILEHLRRQTGVNFKPYKMDLETLKEYQEYSKSLTENDRDRLKKLKGNEFGEVIDYMLNNNCKLEQEAIRF